MQQYSADGTPLEVEVLSGHLLFIDPLYLQNIKEDGPAPTFATYRARAVEFIQLLEKRYFPYGGGMLLGYKQAAVGSLTVPISSIVDFDSDGQEAQAAIDKARTVFASDSGICLIMDLSNFNHLLDLLEVEDIFDLSENKAASFTEETNALIGNKGWGIIQNPGLGQGFDFAGSGLFLVTC